MEIAGTVPVGALGLFVGAGIWTVSRAQAAKRPLFAGPVCHACGEPLPAVGWLPFQGVGGARRCLACGVSEKALRVWFELGVAAYFMLLAVAHGWSFDLIPPLIFAVPLLVILLVDWWTRLIYTNVIGLGVILGLVFAAAEGPRELVNALMSAAGAAGIFGLLFVMAALIYRNIRVVPFGLGDVYLAAMIGAMVRYPAVVSALFLGVLLAGVILVVLLLSRRVSRQTPVPYGPFLCAGALLTLVMA